VFCAVRSEQVNELAGAQVAALDQKDAEEGRGLAALAQLPLNPESLLDLPLTAVALLDGQLAEE
jgi:hypothetical protein